MRRWSYAMLLLSAIGFFTSCGSSELDCVSDCGSAALKSHTLCKSENGNGTHANIDCGDVMMAKNDQCMAGCYGK